MWFIERRLSEFHWEREIWPRESFDECSALLRQFPRYMRATFVCPEDPPMNVDLIRSFHRPAPGLYRAYDHLIAARLGMTLMVPVAASVGRLDPLVDQCPVPWLEATSILAVDHADAQPLSVSKMMRQVQHQRPLDKTRMANFARDLMEAFSGPNGVYFQDQDWRHAQIRLASGEEPCRVLIGERGVRLAFVPDFLEGLL
jgi:hypothetical protein